MSSTAARAHTVLSDDGWGLQLVVHTTSGHVIMPATQIDTALRLVRPHLPAAMLREVISPSLRALCSHYGLPPAAGDAEDLPRDVASVLLPVLHDPLQAGELAPPDEDIPPQVRHILTGTDAREAAARLVGRSPARPVVRNLATSLLGDRSGLPPDLLPTCFAWVGARLGLVDNQVAAILDADPEAPRLAHVSTLDEIRKLIVLLDGLPGAQLTKPLQNALNDDIAQDELRLAADLTRVVRPPDWSRGGPSTTSRILERVNERWLTIHGDAPLPTPTPTLQLGETSGLRLRWLATPRELAALGHRMANCLASHTRDYVVNPARVSAVVIDDDDVPVAALTLDRRRQRLVELKGPGNSPLTKDGEAAIRNALVAAGLLGTA